MRVGCGLLLHSRWRSQTYTPSCSACPSAGCVITAADKTHTYVFTTQYRPVCCRPDHSVMTTVKGDYVKLVTGYDFCCRRSNSDKKNHLFCSVWSQSVIFVPLDRFAFPSLILIWIGAQVFMDFNLHPSNIYKMREMLFSPYLSPFMNHCTVSRHKPPYQQPPSESRPPLCRLLKHIPASLTFPQQDTFPF